MRIRRVPAPVGPGNIRAILFVLAGTVLLAACTRSTPDYFPLQPGRYWQYHIHKETMKYPEDLKLTVRGLPPAQFEGRMVERRIVNDRFIQFFARETRGIVRVATALPEAAAAVPDSPPEPVLMLPLEAGREWTQQSTTRVLEVVVDPFRTHVNIREPVLMTYRIAALNATVTVPAGRYTGCVQVKSTGMGHYKGWSAILPADISVEQDDWYAPGVGLVKSHRIERTTSIVVPRGEYLQELEVSSWDGAAAAPQ